jgi:hypothetical protein
MLHVISLEETSAYGIGSGNILEVGNSCFGFRQGLLGSWAGKSGGSLQLPENDVDYFYRMSVYLVADQVF